LYGENDDEPVLENDDERVPVAWTSATCTARTTTTA
jgi:hypothetical protein